MTSAKEKNIVLKECKLAGIIQAIQKGLRNLPALNPFSDIFQIIKLDTVEPNLRAVIDKTAEDLEVLMMMMTTRKCMKSTVMRFMFLMTILLMRQTKSLSFYTENCLIVHVVFKIAKIFFNFCPISKLHVKTTSTTNTNTIINSFFVLSMHILPHFIKLSRKEVIYILLLFNLALLV